MVYFDDRPKKFSLSNNPTLKVYQDVPHKRCSEPAKEPSFKKPTLEVAVEDYKFGCKEAFNYLYNHYKSKIEYVANTYKDEDIVQELATVLLNCAKKYEPGGSSCFNTLFWHSARNHVRMYRGRDNSLKRKAPNGVVSMNAMSNDGDMTLENIIADENAKEQIVDSEFITSLQQYIFPKVDELDRKIIIYLSQGYNINDISRDLHESTNKIYVRIKRLRDNTEAGRALRDLLHKNIA
jgi:RNA polymerase sigma factor (sigma-70 family)